jgi:hypothetical protein
MAIRYDDDELGSPWTWILYLDAGADVVALREAGLGDREIFEATAFVGFRLAFSAPTGTLTKKIHDQLRYEVSTPPSGTPAAAPLPEAAP